MLVSASALTVNGVGHMLVSALALTVHGVGHMLVSASALTVHGVGHRTLMFGMLEEIFCFIFPKIPSLHGEYLISLGISCVVSGASFNALHFL